MITGSRGPGGKSIPQRNTTLKASWSSVKFLRLVWTLHPLISKKSKGPLTKDIVTFKLSLNTGLWKVLTYLVVAPACKIVFRCDVYFWWAVHLIIKTAYSPFKIQKQWLSLARLHHSTCHSFYASFWIWLLVLLHLFPFLDAFHYSGALWIAGSYMWLCSLFTTKSNLPIHPETVLIFPAVLSILV